MDKLELAHWRLEYDEQQVLWAYLDRNDAKVNTINLTVLNELNTLLSHVEDNQQLKALVIASGKSKGFIAGADIEQFKDLHELDHVMHLINTGQKVFDRLATLPITTVAMIDGFCLGGGLELALACRYRVATDVDATRLGLPEVMLGIQPGWGGTVRLPRLIGAHKALPLMIQGKALRAKQAYRLGLLDALVPVRQLEVAARYYAQRGPRARKRYTFGKLLECSPMRVLLAWFIRRQLQKRVQQTHYPAPYAILANWQDVGTSRELAFAAEAESVASLFLNYTTRNLVNIFFLREKLKNSAKTSAAKIKHVHVIGAGVMGGDIAAWCAGKGLYVTLQDQSPKQIAPAIARAHKSLTRACKDKYTLQRALDNLVPDIQGHGVAHADVIIEAIIEDLVIKQQVFKNIEQRARADALLATNTSSIPLESISEVLQQPERLVGIHFFNPVARMPLVEIVRAAQTAQAVEQRATAFVAQIDKLPLPVKSSPGFLINRILSPYLMESVALLDEGVPAQLIDEAAVDFGMPMGPIELADKIGLDICLLVGSNLTEAFGGQVPRHLQVMVNKGLLGCKSGEGFYKYRKGKPIKRKLKLTERKKHAINQITERLVLRMLNEVVACLREQVVANGETLDAGMIFGTGFAPFRGGPMQYARSRGIAQIIERLNYLTQSQGERFQADPYWSNLESHE